MAQQEETKLKCIDYTEGAKISDFLRGIEEFVRYQSKETCADSEHKAIFIVAVDGDKVICSPLGDRRKNIVAIASAMKAENDVANIITLASMLFCGKNKTLDDLIKDIAK